LYMYQVLGDYCLVYNMEREYTVIANTREDLPALEAEITASSGAGPIPNRSVDIANPRPGSRIQTHFMLTDEEAEELRKDPRVRAVEIPPEQRDDISIGLHASQVGRFYRGSGLNSEYINWGLRRCVSTSNNFYDTNTSTRLTEVEGAYEYAMDGTGVDVVIQDSGIDPDHPEWNDYNGVSRLQQIDWYTESGLPGTQSVNHYRDLDGHGSHCASIAAGLIYGWAKGAHIYSQKLSGLETKSSGSDGTGINISDAFDCIRLWHNAKTNGRPTVVNMSWGYGANVTGDPDSGVYRGTPWTWGVDYGNRAILQAATGVSQNYFNSGTSHRIPVRVASVDAEVDDMIADGIHVCIAAGNNLHKVDLPTGDDYDNEVTFDGTTRTYHRGSSPYSLNAFMVGNIDSGFQNQGGQEVSNALPDQVSVTTTRGPGVNIFAPGTNIMAATSRLYDTGSYTTTSYPTDPTFPIMSIGGTSMASPQVAGVVAQHLQVFPTLTPAEMQARIIADSKSVLFSTGPSGTDYDRIYDSLMGAPNRMLYNKYGKQAITTNVSSILGSITVT
jgi:subtilisin family serine protease